MRTFENLQYGNESVIKASLEALADKTTGVEEYSYDVGMCFGRCRLVGDWC